MTSIRTSCTWTYGEWCRLSSCQFANLARWCGFLMVMSVNDAMNEIFFLSLFLFSTRYSHRFGSFSVIDRKLAFERNFFLLFFFFFYYFYTPTFLFVIDNINDSVKYRIRIINQEFTQGTFFYLIFQFE